MSGLSDLLYDSKDAIVDIVFIHGLQGDREETWSTNHIFWPKTLLPEAVPTARIFSWGYDSKIAHFWAKAALNRIDNYAYDLCTDLASMRDLSETTTRPIIFVAHSLGGLVVANALVLGQNSPDQHINNIAKYTRGIVFLGTPHEGSSKAKWAMVGERLLRSFKSTSQTNIKDLEEDSEKLSELGKMFPELLRRRGESREPGSKIEVACFFEGQQSPIGVIVSETSASVAGYRPVSILADHQNMCKFASANNAGYKRVSGTLARWTKELGNQPKEEEKKAPEFQSTATFNGNNSGQQFGQLNTAGGSLSFTNTR